MAASVDPSGNQGGGGASAARNPSNGNAAAAAGNPGLTQVLKHDTGACLDWSAEDQTLLEELIAKYASEPVVARYAIIAQQIPGKFLRGIAFRCRWMTNKESGKRRKDDLTRRSKDKKDKVGDPSEKPPAHLAARPLVPPYTLPALQIDNDDEVSYQEIGGIIGQLLEHNSQVFHQISVNLSNYQTQENISLFCQTRDNILKILKEAEDVPEIMRQMPPLPTVNEELSNSILRPPRSRLNYASPIMYI